MKQLKIIFFIIISCFFFFVFFIKQIIKNNLKKGLKMPHKSPETYGFLTYIWVIFLSVWGGMASHLYHFKMTGSSFSLSAFFIDLLISGFVGLITFFLCESSGFDSLLTAVLVGVSAHMGTRAIFLFQGFFVKTFSLTDDKHQKGG